MPLSRERLVRNQVIFREVNERLRALADAIPDGKADYLCECSDVDCTEKIELRPFEYEAARARANAFIIVPGHERVEVEWVVDQADRFAIVEKFVPVGQLAGDLNPTEEAWPTRGV